MALRKILSAFGKLGIVALIAVAFAFGLLMTVYLSLRSPNIQVPDVVNQSYVDGEKTLGKAGLDIRERAKRYKPDVPAGVILDQSPHAGEIVKGGQTIAVVVSRPPKEGEQPPHEAAPEETPDEKVSRDAGDSKNENQNANRRKNTNANTNKNANGNLNANAHANQNAGNRNASNANARNSNSGNANLSGNRNANQGRNGNANQQNHNRNTNANTRNANAGARGTNSNANRRPN